MLRLIYKYEKGAVLAFIGRDSQGFYVVYGAPWLHQSSQKAR